MFRRAAMSFLATLAIVLSQVALAAAGGVASVRFMPILDIGAAPVDVYVDGGLVFSDVDLWELTDRLDVPVGDHNVMMTAAGDPGTVVIDTTALFDLGGTTVVAWGGGNIAMAHDNNQPVADAALLRVWPLAADTTFEPLNVTDPDGNVLAGPALFPIPPAYIELPAGTHELNLRTLGDAVLFGFTVDLEAGTSYTAFVVEANEQMVVNLVVDAVFTAPEPTPVPTPVPTTAPTATPAAAPLPDTAAPSAPDRDFALAVPITLLALGLIAAIAPRVKRRV